MFRNNIWSGWAAFVIVFGSGSFTASAENCAEKTNVEERLVCIEKKADAAAAMLNDALTGVKIEQAAHPGICLFFKDNNQPAYSVGDCTHSQEQTFNIHK